jgi:hypothetical protein
MHPGTLASLEEFVGQSLHERNVLRPLFEEGVLIFKYLWK